MSEMVAGRSIISIVNKQGVDVLVLVHNAIAALHMAHSACPATVPPPLNTLTSQIQIQKEIACSLALYSYEYSCIATS